MDKNKLKIKKNNSKAVERYKKKRRKEILFFSFLLLFIISIFLFANSSYVKIKNINVYGVYQLNEEEIISNLGIDDNTKYWNIDEEEIKNKILSKHNIINYVDVEKKIFNTLNINVSEKKIIAIEKDEEGNYKTILEDGETFNGIVKNELNIPLIENFKDNKEQRNNVIKNILNIDEKILGSISEIVYLETDYALIYMKDGQKIKINVNNFANKLNYYFEIEKYIDDKKNTTLNITNGAYLENNKTIDNKEKNIKKILINDKIDEENENKKNN